ncbi:MAG: DUF177 domain-containing protein [Limnobacter sp.]|nr:DUF177 domain-containing protein [Limnobacter sp.]
MVFSHQVEKWQMSGSQNRRGESELLIQGTMQADMQCSHCGKGVLYDLEVFRQLRLVKSEQEAEAYEEGLLGDHQDVVACIGLVNLRDWLEDELLLSLPMLARHATCSAPELELSELAKQQPAGFATEGTTNNASAAAPTETETNKPFAALGNLLGRRSK